MAIIKIGAAQKMGASPMPDGYFSFEVVEVGDPVMSSTKKSYHMHSRFRVIDDEAFDGKELRVTFNTEVNRNGNFGSMWFMPYGQLAYLKAAIDGKSVDTKTDEEIDNASLTGGKFDAKVHRTISDGNVINTISDFLPYGTGRAKEKEAIPF